jgi:hypothetical protein
MEKLVATFYFGLFTVLNLAIAVLVWRQLGAVTIELASDPAAARVAGWLRWLIPAWFVIAVAVAASPLFQRPTAETGTWLALPLSVVIPVLMSLALRRSAAYRRVLERLTSAWLIGIHALRIPIGGLFLVLGAQGLAPTTFTLEAGIGDLAAGLLAIPLALAVRRTAAPRWTIVAWNIFALADLLNALRLGITVVLPFVVATQTPVLPATVPLFGVPLYIMTHITLFGRVSRHGSAR